MNPQGDNYRSYDIRQEGAHYIASSQAEDVELTSKDLKRLTDGIDELWDATDKLGPGQESLGPAWFMNWLNDPSRNRIDLDNVPIKLRKNRGAGFRVVRRFVVTSLAFIGAVISALMLATPLFAGADLDNDGEFDMYDVAILAAKTAVYLNPSHPPTINQVVFNGDDYEAAFRRTPTANKIELVYLRPAKGVEGLSR